MAREVTRCLLLFLLFLAHAASAAELVGRVVKIQDGDTLTVQVARKQIKVRLTDIDAPERKQPFGERSRQSLAELCARREARTGGPNLGRLAIPQKLSEVLPT